MIPFPRQVQESNSAFGRKITSVPHETKNGVKLLLIFILEAGSLSILLS